MSPSRWIQAAIGVTVFSLTVRVAAQEKSSGVLSPTEFTNLAKELHVKNQPWATIPWKISVTEARTEAARAKKPIFLVVNTGNCLGFV